MQKNGVWKHSASLCRRLISVLIASVCTVIILFSVYFFISNRQASITEHIQQTETAVKISAQNIDYYIENCITSARSAYINPTVFDIMNRSTPETFSLQDANHLYDYLKSVYFSSSSVKQVFLVLPRANRTMLLSTKNMQFSIEEFREDDDDFPQFNSWETIYVQPTHDMSNYGHLIRFNALQPNAEEDNVFTIWLPIYNLPQGNNVIALMALDFPVSFLNDNCGLIYNEDEQMYITDKSGKVFASSNSDALSCNLNNLCPGLRKVADKSKSFHVVDDNELIIGRKLESKFLDWCLVKLVPMTKIYNENLKQTIVLIGIFFAGLSVVVIINVRYIRRYTAPLRQITQCMENVVYEKKWNQAVRLSDYVSYNKSDEIGRLIVTFDSMISSIQYYIIRQYELELSYLKSTLKMLQAQINPHFIYNTLQSLATRSLKNDDTEQYQMISSFGQMLHYAMVLEPAMVPLQQELDYVQRYIALQKMRFKHEATIEIIMQPGADQLLIPRMTLQPLIENSIMHGGILKRPNTYLQIRVEYKDKFTLIEIRDNGVPVSEEVSRHFACYVNAIRRWYLDYILKNSAEPHSLPDSYEHFTDSGDHSSIGMENVLLRLMLNFGADCEVNIFGNDISGTTVTLRFPHRLVQF